MASSITATGNQKERWIHFRGMVNDKSATALMRLVDGFHHEGVSDLHLVISSVGGNLFYGVQAYAHLAHSGMNVSTYNLTTVQSIGVILYCAGGNRFCNSNGTFMMHPVALPVAEGQYNAKQYQDFADTCNANTHAISQIVANASRKNEPDVFADMNRTIWLNAQEGIQYGLVTTVSDVSMTGRQYVIVQEDGSVHNPASTATRPSPVPLPGVPSIPSIPSLPQARPPGTN
jgi:ATP-dependent protease ClpP protease subunit